MKHILYSLLLLTSLNFFAQNTITDDDFAMQLSSLKANITSVQYENNRLKISNNQLKSDIGTLNSKLNELNAQFQILSQNVSLNTSNIVSTNENLSGKISSTEASTNQKFTQVDNSLSKNSLWSIIGVLGAIIVSGLLYFLLSKRQKTDKSDVEGQIAITKKALEEEGVKLDTKLTEVLETQLKLVQEERAKIPANKSEEIDHSLALKVADEIVRINKNLSNMDAATKGLKQLSASVKRIEDNFVANGYEMPELLNKPFDPRMKMITNMVEDENLEKGFELITKIIKPQVNFKGVMIQSAQVEVSVGQ